MKQNKKCALLRWKLDNDTILTNKDKHSMHTLVRKSPDKSYTNALAAMLILQIITNVIFVFLSGSEVFCDFPTNLKLTRTHAYQPPVRPIAQASDLALIRLCFAAIWEMAGACSHNGYNSQNSYDGIMSMCGVTAAICQCFKMSFICSDVSLVHSKGLQIKLSWWLGVSQYHPNWRNLFKVFEALWL